MKPIFAVGILALLWAQAATAGEDLMIGKWVLERSSGRLIALIFEPDGNSRVEVFDEDTQQWIVARNHDYYWSISYSADHYSLTRMPVDPHANPLAGATEHEVTFLSPDMIELRKIVTRQDGNRVRIRDKLLFVRWADVS